MPYKIPCRCGANARQFKTNIGEFYIEECCAEAGFDHLGRSKNAEGEAVSEADEVANVEGLVRQEAAPATPSVPEGHALAPEPKTKPSSASFLKKLIGLKPGRGKLRDLNRDELIKMAKDKGLEVKEGATKNELIASILA